MLLITYIATSACDHSLIYVHIFIVVVITRPPEDTTVCRGSDVIISCGPNSTDSFDTIWGFNGSQATSVVNNRMYQAINQTLTIFSINYTTTVQCVVHIRASLPIILTSGTATVTVVGMHLCMYLYAHNAGKLYVCRYMHISYIIIILLLYHY